jgi:hypothetical protein
VLLLALVVLRAAPVAPAIAYMPRRLLVKTAVISTLGSDVQQPLLQLRRHVLLVLRCQALPEVLAPQRHARDGAAAAASIGWVCWICRRQHLKAAHVQHDGEPPA